MKLFITADWHLTSRPMDEYRWSVFEWCAESARKHRVDAILNLGDLTHFKDEHPAELVNRVSIEMRALSSLCPVYLLRGNHDYSDQNHTFFNFLDEEGSGIVYITKPAELVLGDRLKVPIGFVPYSKDFVEDLRSINIAKCEYLFLHQPMAGARLESGREVEMTRFSPFNFEHMTKAHIYSGDIHTPQTVGPVKYVGSPHPVKFGDDYKTGGLIVESGKPDIWVPRSTIRKMIIRVDRLIELPQLHKGDQVKVIYSQPEYDAKEWQEAKRTIPDIIAEEGATLHGLDLVIEAYKNPNTKDRKLSPGSVRKAPAEIVGDYGRSRGLSAEIISAGRECLP